MKSKSPLILINTTFSLLVLPTLALAQQNAYKFLEVGLFGTGDTIDLTNPAQFETFIKSAYTLFLTLCIVAAVIMIVIHGLEYMLTSIPLVKVKAKGRLWSAIGGLIIALTAWLFLSTLNPKFVDLNLNLGQVLVGNNTPGSTGTGTGGNGTGTSTSPGGNNGTGGHGGRTSGTIADPNKFAPGLGDGVYGKVPSNEFDVRAQLRSKGITVNDDGSCTPNNVGGCKTYVGGLDTSEIVGLIAMQNSCGCSFVISGAAEQGGHASGADRHYAGAAVDIRMPNDQALGYIQAHLNDFRFTNDERNKPGQSHYHVEF